MFNTDFLLEPLPQNTNDLPQKRARAGDVDPKTAREWFPWTDRVVSSSFLQWMLSLNSIDIQSCTLDILMHLPRSLFSRRQLDLFLWLLRVNGVHDVPSTSSLKTLNDVLQNMCGIDTIKYEGKQGHSYHVNSLAQILAQVRLIFSFHILSNVSQISRK